MSIHPLYTSISERPARFTYPFCYEPHPLCQTAAAEVQQYIATHEELRCDADHGKMFGVLVVDSPNGSSAPYHFLAAYTVVCWPGATTGLTLCRRYSMPNSPTDTLRRQNAKSPLVEATRRCRNSSSAGCFTSTACSTPMARRATWLTSGSRTIAARSCAANSHYLQEARATAVHPSYCNTPISTACIQYVWRSSGGDNPPRRSCATT